MVRQSLVRRWKPSIPAQSGEYVLGFWLEQPGRLSIENYHIGSRQFLQSRLSETRDRWLPEPSEPLGLLGTGKGLRYYITRRWTGSNLLSQFVQLIGRMVSRTMSTCS